jgi:cytochrome c2
MAAMLYLRPATDRRGMSAPRRRRLAPLAALGLLLVLGGCDESGAESRFGELGDPAVGAAYIAQTGCGSCHIIPGIAGARGLVGPPLDHMGKRMFIAGLLQNTPANMIAWLRNPQEIVPGNAMPDLGLNERQARDITAYLYTLD